MAESKAIKRPRRWLTALPECAATDAAIPSPTRNSATRPRPTCPPIADRGPDVHSERLLRRGGIWDSSHLLIAPPFSPLAWRNASDGLDCEQQKMLRSRSGPGTPTDYDSYSRTSPHSKERLLARRQIRVEYACGEHLRGFGATGQRTLSIHPAGFTRYSASRVCGHAHFVIRNLTGPPMTAIDVRHE